MQSNNYYFTCKGSFLVGREEGERWGQKWASIVVTGPKNGYKMGKHCFFRHHNPFPPTPGRLFWGREGEGIGEVAFFASYVQLFPLRVVFNENVIFKKILQILVLFIFKKKATMQPLQYFIYSVI